jgi:hypothetical protein
MDMKAKDTQIVAIVGFVGVVIMNGGRFSLGNDLTGEAFANDLGAIRNIWNLF